MSKQRGQYRGTDKRRREIIDAALACFTELGFVDCTMADIRRKSGASNGSVYHHFKSKEQLAAAVYLTGVLEYQAGLLRELEGCRDARGGIHALVRFHLTWVRDHAEWARYLVRMRHADFMGDAESSISLANAGFSLALGPFFRRHVADGTLRRLPGELYLSLILGPAQELARHWMLAGKPVNFDLAIRELGDAAWLAVRAPSAPSRPLTKRPPPATRRAAKR